MLYSVITDDNYYTYIYSYKLSSRFEHVLLVACPALLMPLISTSVVLIICLRRKLKPIEMHRSNTSYNIGCEHRCAAVVCTATKLARVIACNRGSSYAAVQHSMMCTNALDVSMGVLLYEHALKPTVCMCIMPQPTI